MQNGFTAAAAAAPHLSPRCPRASSSSLSWTLPQPAGGRDGPPRTQCTMSGRPGRSAAAAAAPPDPATSSTPLRDATAAAGAPALRCAAFSCRAVAAAAPQAVGDHRLWRQCLISRRTRLCQPSSAPAPATPCSIYRLLLLTTAVVARAVAQVDEGLATSADAPDRRGWGPAEALLVPEGRGGRHA